MRRVVLLLVVAACSGKTGESRSHLEGDPGEPECGFAVVDDQMPIDACLEGTVIAGPETYTRTSGPPNQFDLSVPVAAETGLCVRVANGDGSAGTAVPSARIDLGGALVFGPSHFTPHVAELEGRLDVAAGDHTLHTELSGGPGRFLTVEVLDGIAPPHEPITGGEGILRAFNLRASPPAFSPDGDGIIDTTELSVLAEFIPPVPGAGGPHTYELVAEFQIASGTSCMPVITLTTTVVLAEPTSAVVAVEWDGRDALGDLVPEDVYYYRAIVEAVKVTPSMDRDVLDTVTTQIQRVSTDVTPPGLFLPRTMFRTVNDVVVVQGQAEDTGSGLGDGVVFTEGVVETDVLFDPGNTFQEEVTTPVLGPDDDSDTKTIIVSVSDRAGNTTTEVVTVTRLAPTIPGERIVVSLPGVALADMAALFDATGALGFDVIRRKNRYRVEYPSEADAASAVAALEASPFVGEVTPHGIDIPQTSPRDPWFEGEGSLNQESLMFIDAEDAWDTTTGSRLVTIAVFDTGIDYLHPELARNMFLNERELPVSLEFGASRLLDANGDGVITLDDLQDPVNAGKIPGAGGGGDVGLDDLVDGDRDVDIGPEGDLNGDGCPGICGEDDDLDGLADLQDQEVAAADYDSDGVRTCGNDGICQQTPGDVFGLDDDPEDRDVHAPKDDDENGWADDIIGYDFGCDKNEGRGRTCGHDNDPFDDGEHGTQCAGIIGATEDPIGPIFPDVSVVGLNWEVRLLPIRMVEHDNGDRAPNFASTRGSDYVADLARRPETHIKVVNYSFGSLTQAPNAMPTSSTVASDLDRSGVLLVASAGNDEENIDAPNTSYSPAGGTNDNIVSVAACNDDGRLWTQGSPGPVDGSNVGTTSVDLCAPGGWTLLSAAFDPYILTTTETEETSSFSYTCGFLCYKFSRVRAYSQFYGTSAAAPHVAGVLGLMQAVNPDIPYLRMRELLLDSVKPIFVLVPMSSPPEFERVNLKNATNGHLDAAAAVAAAAAEPIPPALPGEENVDQAPVVSDDGSVIVFTSNRITTNNPQGRSRLWAAASDGTGLTELLPPAVLGQIPVFANDVSPSISADGTRVVWASDREGTFDIFTAFLVPIAGGFELRGQERRTTTTASDIQPKMSADGMYVAFASDAEFFTPGDTLGDFEIYRITTFSGGDPVTPVNQDGGQITQDTEAEFMGVDPLFADDRRPSISANGVVLAWVNAFAKPVSAGGNPGIVGTTDAIGVGFIDSPIAPGVILVGYWQPEEGAGSKTFVSVTRDGSRVIHHGLVPFVGNFWHSTSIDGTDTVGAPFPGGGVTGFIGFAASADGSTVMELRAEGAGPFVTLKDLVIRPFLDAEPTVVIAGNDAAPFMSCGVVEIDELVSGLALEHPACTGALSADGQVGVFVATFDPPSDTEPREKDIFVQNGSQLIRITRR